MGMLVWLGLFSSFSSQCFAGKYSKGLLLIDMKIVMDYTFVSQHNNFHSIKHYMVYFNIGCLSFKLNISGFKLNIRATQYNIASTTKNGLCFYKTT